MNVEAAPSNPAASFIIRYSVLDIRCFGGFSRLCKCTKAGTGRLVLLRAADPITRGRLHRLPCLRLERRLRKQKRNSKASTVKMAPVP